MARSAPSRSLARSRFVDCADGAQVKLVVLDSLSSHLRPTSLTVSLKSTTLALVKVTLASVTSAHSVSVRHYSSGVDDD